MQRLLLLTCILGFEAFGYHVGVRTLAFQDSERERLVTTEIWYPCDESFCEREIKKSTFRRHGAINAPIADEKFPLVIISHGNGSRRESMSWIAEALARNGYIVAAPDHVGNTFRDTKPHTHFAVWERAGDMNFMLKQLLKSELAEKIDKSRISALGYSLGGATVLMLIGGKYDYRNWLEHCKPPTTDSECSWWSTLDLKRVNFSRADNDYFNPKIRSAIVLNPAVIPAFDKQSLKKITVPLTVISSGQDEHLAFELYAGALASAVPQSRLVHLPYGSHFVFLTQTNALGMKVIPDIHAAQLATGADRAQAEVQGPLLKFLDSCPLAISQDQDSR